MTSPDPALATRTALIVGATAGLGRALAEQMGEAGYHLVLTGRDVRDLDALSRDLRLRHGVRVEPVVLDLNAGPDVSALRSACASLPPLQAILLPAGAVREDDSPDLAAGDAAEIHRVNFFSLTQIARELLPQLDRKLRPVIVGFGSIAAVRGRTKNAHYSAAKRALASYFESLRHALLVEGVLVQFYQPGYLDTGLAAGLTLKLPKASPRHFARIVLRDMHKDIGIRYFPFWWRPLCVLLRLMPWAVFRRLHL